MLLLNPTQELRYSLALMVNNKKAIKMFTKLISNKESKHRPNAVLQDIMMNSSLEKARQIFCQE